MSNRYVSDRFLPDKAIDLIDEAGSKVRLKSHTTPNNLKEIEQEIEKVKNEKDAAGCMLKSLKMLLTCVINKQNLKANMKKLKMNGRMHKMASDLIVRRRYSELQDGAGIPLTKINGTKILKNFLV